MYELRWILLLAGVVLVVGLWIHETRRTKAAERARQQDPGIDRVEPRVAENLAAPDLPAVEMPQIRATSADRVSPPLNPPVIEIPAGVEPELSRPQSLRGDDTLAGTMPVVDAAAMHAEQRQPWVRTQPIDVSRGAAPTHWPAAQPEQPAQPEVAMPPPNPESAAVARQRIVAIRLISATGRWNGRQLCDALEAEGMRFGRYSIYHFQRDDGKTIFYAASLVEPGSFDPDKLSETAFPGVSIFAVLPGLLDAPTLFDQMLATGRRLAERLQGQLQDEQGSSLTAQRVLSLREELVHFEHVATRQRVR